MQKDKVFQIFLMSNGESHCLKYTMANWNGVIYQIDRNDVQKCEKDKKHKISEYLKQNGIYFLLGESNDDNSSKTFYVGQAEVRNNGTGLSQRIKEHFRDEEAYWNKVLAITTTDNSLSSMSLHYMENEFYNLAKNSKRYEVVNDVEPNKGNLTEENKCILNDFIDDVKNILENIGYNMFIPIASAPVSKKKTKTDNPMLFFRTGNALAKGMEINGGFLLLKDSECLRNPVDSVMSHTKAKRYEYEDKIEYEDEKAEKGVLKENIEFGSPSGAACFVSYRNVNGLDVWKDKNGKSLKALNAERFVTEPNEPKR